MAMRLCRCMCMCHMAAPLLDSSVWLTVRCFSLTSSTDGEGCSPFLSVVESGRRKLATWVLDECSRHDVAVNFDVVDKQVWMV